MANTNEKNAYTFKIRWYEDFREWETIPEWLTNWPFTKEEATNYIKHLFKANPNAQEIRYTIDGSLQGHYVTR